MELRANPPYNGYEPADWAAWEEVHSVLAGPLFQFLRVLYINMAPASNHQEITWDYTTIEMCQEMAAAYPLLTIRGARVSFFEDTTSPVSEWCTFCSNNPWN
jgi:hypothetical protein